MIRAGFDISIASSDESRALKAIERLRHRTPSDITNEASIDYHQVDLSDSESVRDLIVRLDRKGCQYDVLINNAAVCLAGSCLEIAQKTLQVNVLSPITLMDGLIWAKLPKVSKNSVNFSRGKKIIVNVASGEGELGYLHSRLAEKLKTSAEFVGPHQVVSTLAELLDQFDEEIEYAFGPTPMYSLSKAALIAATHAYSNLDPMAEKVLINAVCPGDVLTDMLTEEQRDEALSPWEASLDVASLILDPPRGEKEGDTPLTGKFFRNRELAQW
ncbi:hypothetical protein AAMO2058_000329200 [Amorphochlora amoebiformis]